MYAGGDWGVGVDPHRCANRIALFHQLSCLTSLSIRATPYVDVDKRLFSAAGTLGFRTWLNDYVDSTYRLSERGIGIGDVYRRRIPILCSAVSNSQGQSYVRLSVLLFSKCASC